MNFGCKYFAKKIASRHYNNPALQFAMTYSFRLTYSSLYFFVFSALLFSVPFAVKKNAPKLPSSVFPTPDWSKRLLHATATALPFSSQ